MTTAVAFIDARDGMLCAVVDGHSVRLASRFALTMVLHGRGVRYVAEPPPDEDWPDYVRTNAAFYLAINEELCQIQELIRDHYPEEREPQPDTPNACIERIQA